MVGCSPWVEGVWELIMGSILAFVLIKVTALTVEVDREVAVCDHRHGIDYRHSGYWSSLLLSWNSEYWMWMVPFSLLWSRFRSHDDSVCL